MINYLPGDIVAGFKSGYVEAIGHQANCMNTMNSGVAKAIRAEFPEVYEADCQTVKGDIGKLGSLTFVIVPVAGHAPGWIFNLYGQYDYGREPGKVYTDVEALASSFSQMRLFIDAAGITSVGFPKLGAGLGGANWSDIELLIEAYFGDLDVTIYTN